MQACRELQVDGTKSRRRGRNMWNEFVKVDMKRLGLVEDDDLYRHMWRS